MTKDTGTDHKMDKLLATGIRQGSLALKDILAAYPEAAGDPAQIEAVVASLARLGVMVTNGEGNGPAPVVSAPDLEEVEEPPVDDLEDEEPALDEGIEAEPTWPMTRTANATEAEAGGDPVRMYLREIGQVALLNGNDEKRYATSIQEGAFAEERLKAEADSLSPQERQALELKVEQGYIAQRKLAEANLRLVVSVAKRYVGRGMSFLDLIQEGNLGLLRAVEKFDHTKGFKFSTYATWWIRQAISRAIADQARTIRIPVHMVESINRVSRSMRDLQQKLGREPTAEEIASTMEEFTDEDRREIDEPGGDEDVQQDVQKRLRRATEKVRQLMRVSQEPMSLETPVGSEENSVLVDFIPDESIASPVDETNRGLLREQMRDILGSLSEREREVLTLRFGLDDGEGRTLEEVGQQFGVTRERIRQIEAKALRKLRHPTRSRKLKDYLS